MADEYGFKSEFTYPGTLAPSHYPQPPPISDEYPTLDNISHPHPPPINCQFGYYPPPPNSCSNIAPPIYSCGGSGPAISGQRAYHWIDWNADRMVPPSAVHGGVDKDGSQIYVGRAYHEGDWIPAKVIPERHIAYVAHGGGEHTKDTFQLLCEQRFDWVPSSGGSIPMGAVEGGRTDSGEPLYIGRVWHDGAHTVGKVHPSHSCCYIPYDSQEMSFCDYEILVLRC
ncbi:hypothetical protein RI129_001069 [Pyrocoelia pectoralis]|uniref:Uncharacterized protein n=1 Tax=Pyrocoelia pectoralis TaxID=417401 RepID=A0AAN7VLU7_9COLE